MIAKIVMLYLTVYNCDTAPMIAKIVMLYLTVYNCDTGAVLYQSARQMPEFSLSGDRIEDCS